MNNYLIVKMKALWWTMFVASCAVLCILGVLIALHATFPSLTGVGMLIVLVPVTIAYAYGLEVLLGVNRTTVVESS